MRPSLSLPDEALARRILTGVAYKDRIPAGRLTSRLGIMRGSVRGLPELALYLTPASDTLPAINLDRLADWLEQVIADPELAQNVRAAVQDAASYVEACARVHEIVQSRFQQAMAAVVIDADGSPERREV